MVDHAAVAGTVCGNCGAELAGAYCQACGQKAIGPDVSLDDFFHEAFHEFAHVDGKIVQTLRLLLTKLFLRQNHHMQYVTFLRAINVAGHATVKMADLKEACLSAGCKGVTTLIQSGNVIFESTEKNPSALFQNMRVRLRDLLGGEPQMITRTVRELERMEERAPFKQLKAEPDAKLYVAFLSQAPSRKPKPKKELGVSATTRNWSTVTKIVEFLRQPPATGFAAARLRTSSSRRTGSERRR
jgi:uncharacterized protein (DUF1697 family)